MYFKNTGNDGISSKGADSFPLGLHLLHKTGIREFKIGGNESFQGSHNLGVELGAGLFPALLQGIGKLIGAL